MPQQAYNPHPTLCFPISYMYKKYGVWRYSLYFTMGGAGYGANARHLERLGVVDPARARARLRLRLGLALADLSRRRLGLSLAPHHALCFAMGGAGFGASVSRGLVPAHLADAWGGVAEEDVAAGDVLRAPRVAGGSLSDHGMEQCVL
jgi:hypothetical protein